MQSRDVNWSLFSTIINEMVICYDLQRIICIYRVIYSDRGFSDRLPSGYILFVEQLKKDESNFFFGIDI